MATSNTVQDHAHISTGHTHMGARTFLGFLEFVLIQPIAVDIYLNLIILYLKCM